MSPYPESITCWAAEVNKHFHHLSRLEAWVLALWSYGVQGLQCCGQSQVAGFLAELLKHKVDAVRQQLREWTWAKDDKAGDQRQEVAVSTCFADLLAWVVSGLAPDTRRLALALDATSLKDTVVVLTLSVLYSGCAIPIAWHVLPANRSGAWKPHWLALLAHFRGCLPADWQVLVLADRGLYSAPLFRAICALGWHPFMRINTGGKCRPEGASDFRPLTSLLPAPGQTWQGRVVCFKHVRLPATLLIARDEAHADPWLVLTDLAPEQACVVWYSLRAWIEGGFKDIKRGGWHWERTRMLDPERISRLWLVLAVSLLYTISLGSQHEAEQPIPDLSHLPPTHTARVHATGRPQPRRLSLVTQGRIAFLVALIQQTALALTSFPLPQPWPTQPT